MNPAFEALLFLCDNGTLHIPDRLLFLNAEMAPELRRAETLILFQPRYNKALPLINAGYTLNPLSCPDDLDTAWVLPGKDMEEAQVLLATALLSLRPGGVLVAAAANDAGGKRLAGLFAQLGLEAQEESKSKCRIVHARAENINQKLAEDWRKQGEARPILDGRFLSCPGLHGWDKVDEGSALLARHLPPLRGHVADFGCGWGYLSLHAHGMERVTLIDVDQRAIQIAQENLRRAIPSLAAETLWADLTQPLKPAPAFDAILMNPPFHDGTQSVPALGQAFIATAAKALKPDGTLYLVANRHLPYEKTLQGLFGHVQPLADEGGFKTFACRL